METANGLPSSSSCRDRGWSFGTSYRQVLDCSVIYYAALLTSVLGCIWASAGYNIHLCDLNAHQREEGIAYIKDNVGEYAQRAGLQTQKPGQVEGVPAIKEAVERQSRPPWLAIECVPESISLKLDVMAELASETPGDCIIATNSSSYKSSEMLKKVNDQQQEGVKSRIMNMHYLFPPGDMAVEIMTDGVTDENAIAFMAQRAREAGNFPYVARKESTGFIFNRLWAAIKREALTILAEGVSTPQEIDSLWKKAFNGQNLGPCAMMDSKPFLSFILIFFLL